MSFEKLDALARRLNALEHALAILGADEATHMAVGGGEERAQAMASLAGMLHGQSTDPAVGGWIAAAEAADLNPEQAAAVREFRRHYRNMTSLPTAFVERQVRARLRCEQLWRDLRAKNDWTGFQPALAEVVGLVREEAAMRSEALGIDPYDALIEQHDPGTRAEPVAALFADLKAFLVDFLPGVLERQDARLAGQSRRAFGPSYPIERQRELGLAVMGAVGFDFSRGSLSVSHHPFCGGVPTDVRITTRYRSGEFLSALMGVLHETGHALYEQNLPPAWAHWPVGRARGMAMHESQSLFVEMQMARNPAFWVWALPLVERHTGEAWTLADILPHVHHVERGLIRVDADEVTYPLHVILRFEIERDLIAGRIEVSDIPDLWDAKMQASLGLSTIDLPQDGPMQDVHWPSGAFGYFPSYTLGALIAAQQWSAVARDIPDIESDLAAGRFEALNDWRRRAVWSQGSFWSTPELVERATGEPLNVEHFKAHLRRRYAA